jgi:hypothetical protein
MDPLECVDRIVGIIGDADRAVGRGQAASEASLAAAEGEMGLRFPPSYRAFLAAVGPMRISYGQMGRASLLVYGLNGNRAGSLSGSEVPGAKVGRHASVADRVVAFGPAVVLGAVVDVVEQLHAMAATAVRAIPIRLTGTG